MAITSTCGSHCGIRQNAEGTITREGHCECPECHDGTYVMSGPVQMDDPRAPRNVPMCERWYERAGDYRPWQAGKHLIIRDDRCTPVPDIGQIVPPPTVPDVDVWAAREGGVH